MRDTTHFDDRAATALGKRGELLVALITLEGTDRRLEKDQEGKRRTFGGGASLGVVVVVVDVRSIFTA